MLWNSFAYFSSLLLWRVMWNYGSMWQSEMIPCQPPILPFHPSLSLSPLSLTLTLSINTILIFCGPHLPRWYSYDLEWDKGLNLTEKLQVKPIFWPRGWASPIPHLYLRAHEFACLPYLTTMIAWDQQSKVHITSQACMNINILLGCDNNFPHDTRNDLYGVAWYKASDQNHPLPMRQ